MVHERMAVTSASTIKDAMKMREEKRLVNLPVKQTGRVADSVTRHDLLRAGISLDTTGADERETLWLRGRANRNRTML